MNGGGTCRDGSQPAARDGRVTMPQGGFSAEGISQWRGANNASEGISHKAGRWYATGAGDGTRAVSTFVGLRHYGRMGEPCLEARRGVFRMGL